MNQNQNEFNIENNEIYYGFIAFKEKVLDKNGELEMISRQLAEISSEDNNHMDYMDFFFGHYFPTKYGKEASRFLFDLLVDTKLIIKTLNDNRLITRLYKAELELIAFRHNELIKKLSSHFEHPYSLQSTACVTNGQAEYLLSVKRIDGESLNLFLNLSKSYRLINSLLDTTIKDLSDLDEDKIDTDIIEKFLSLSDKVRKNYKNK